MSIAAYTIFLGPPFVTEVGAATVSRPMEAPFMTSNAGSRAQAEERARGSHHRPAAGLSDQRSSSGERPTADASAAVCSGSPGTNSSASGAATGSLPQAEAGRSAVAAADLPGGATPPTRAAEQRSPAPWSCQTANAGARLAAGSATPGSQATRTRATPQRSAGTGRRLYARIRPLRPPDRVNAPHTNTMIATIS